MNARPTEQANRSRRFQNDRLGNVSAAPPRRSTTDGLALPSSLNQLRSSPQPLSSAASSRRVSMVERVAFQRLSGNIVVDERESAGVGQRGWPLLLSRAQLCEYLGASWGTLKNVLTVRPIDMGANIVRYNRDQIDSWAASLPAKGLGPTNREVSPADHEAPIDTTAAALARARERGGRR